jgi:hypothetical protein
VTTGLSVYLADSWLDMLAATAFTAPAASYVLPHTGDPGASGTSNTIASVPRVAVTWAAAATGAKIASNSPTWSSWSFASPSTITHMSFWDASTSGHFLFSAPVTAAGGSNVVATGNNLVLSPISILFAPIAA